MKKYDYFLGTILVASFGLNFYLVSNLDKFLEKEYTPNIVLAKEVAQKVELKESFITPKIDLSKYKIVSGREDPFKPLVNINQSSDQRSENNNTYILKDLINQKVEKIPFVVRGILQGENNKIVILEKEEKSYVVEEGKEVEGYKIVSIDFAKEEVVFQKGDKKYSVNLISQR